MASVLWGWGSHRQWDGHRGQGRNQLEAPLGLAWFYFIYLVWGAHLVMFKALHLVGLKDCMWIKAGLAWARPAPTCSTISQHPRFGLFPRKKCQEPTGSQ